MLLAALCVLAPARTHAQSDSAAVVAAAQQLLDAINTRDVALAKSVLAAGAQFAAVRVTAAGQAPARIVSDTAFFRQISTGSTKQLERMWSPIVRVRGAIADVWTPYDFHIDGTFSHCGIDTFTLLKTAAGWKIVGIAYTVEPTGCAPSPLGPP